LVKIPIPIVRRFLWVSTSGRSRARVNPAGPRTDLAVRRDWAGTGHDIVRFGVSPLEARWFIESDRRFWRRGPLRPVYTVVEISFRDFTLHHRFRRLCRAPDCPMQAPVGVRS
jgi:hypothetical protein